MWCMSPNTLNTFGSDLLNAPRDVDVYSSVFCFVLWFFEDAGWQLLTEVPADFTLGVLQSNNNKRTCHLSSL